MNHLVTRRTATLHMSSTAKVTDHKGGGGVIDGNLQHRATFSSLEAVENGHLHHRVTTNGTRPERRRRRRETSSTISLRHLKSLSCGTVQRRTARYLRRNPEKVYAVAIFVFGAAILLCLALSAVLQKQQSTSPSAKGGIQGFFHNRPTLKDHDGLDFGNGWKYQDRPHNQQSDLAYRQKKHGDGTSMRHNHRGATATKEMHGSPVIHRPSKPSFEIIFANGGKRHNSNITSSLNEQWESAEMSKEDIAEGEYFDFGNLHIKFSEKEDASFRRKIHQDSWYWLNEYRTLAPDDQNDFYYAFDDDRLRIEHLEKEKEEEEERKTCRRISEHRVDFPNCNTFHETQWIENDAKYLR
jgi:hypothetical protein